MSGTIPQSWYLHQKGDGYPIQRNERDAHMGQPERTEVPKKSSPLIEDVKPGDTIFVKVPGRAEKPVIVRVLVERIEGDILEVELYPEFQLPVRFMKTITKSDESQRKSIGNSIGCPILFEVSKVTLQTV